MSLIHGAPISGFSVNNHDGVDRDTLASARVSQLLGGGRLDVDGILIDLQYVGKRSSHLLHIWTETWLLSDDGDVDVRHMVSLVGNERVDLAQELSAVCTCVAWIIIREMPADIAFTHRTEQGIAARVQGNITIGMRQQFMRVGDITTA